VRRSALGAVLAASAVVVALALPAGAATITIVNRDGAGEGLNDPEVRAPVGGNAGTTLGAQRLIALEAAAAIWGGLLDSPVEIRVGAQFNSLTCSGFSATLGNAGPEEGHFNFAGSIPNTIYPSALADKTAGMDLSPGDDDVGARFNDNLGEGGGCNLDFYLGLDASPPSATDIDLVTVALHELGHGLGFVPFYNIATGVEALGLDDVYELGLERHGFGLLATATDAVRAAASVDDANLHFIGPTVSGALAILTAGVSQGHVQMFAPTTLTSGSSVSHFDTDLVPNQLMEPAYAGPNHDTGLAYLVLCDIGWGPCGTCGDGIIDPNENCDDGDTDPGDGCNAVCRIEACHTCTGAPSVCGPQADDTPCHDGFACTTADACQSGVCTGDAVVCTALDQCHDPGTCNPVSGVCSDPAKPDGSTCDDGESCTSPDECTVGVCGGPLTCVDPFLCYKGKTTKGNVFVPPPTVTLVDQFESLNVTIVKPKGLCTPAEVDGGSTVDAATHLELYPVKAIKGQPKHVKRTALIQNALGSITVQTQKPAFLLVPTNKSLVADPPPVAPTIEVDHYKCYAVKVAKDTPKFPKGLTVTVADQFIAPAQSFLVKKPTHLCTPVDKNGEGLKNAVIHQLCYQVKPTVKNPKHLGLFVHTQFGAERLDTTKEDRVCLPSLKTVL
jgi:cysteine-rich repeat protein